MCEHTEIIELSQRPHLSKVAWKCLVHQKVNLKNFDDFKQKLLSRKDWDKPGFLKSNATQVSLLASRGSLPLCIFGKNQDLLSGRCLLGFFLNPSMVSISVPAGFFC